jgi:hypothetical protein
MPRQSTRLSSQVRTGLGLRWALSGAGVAAAALAAVLITQSLSVEISGVVNSYTAVVQVSTRYIRVSDASAFSTGDKVLVIQMKGASISTADDETYGDITTFGDAGNYEFATVTRKAGDTLHFTRLLCRSYDVAHKVQAVRVPVYEGDVEVTGDLSAAPWDGSKGGILALEVTGKLTLDAHINVQSKGFLGGNFNTSSASGGLTYICDPSSGRGGIKGEGIIELAQAGCRGKLANGGGGGNDHNGGGGGGANYGEGGVGGHGWRSNTAGQLSDTDKGGRGGYSLEAVYDGGTPKLFLGGGGGGGHQNNGFSAPASHGSGIAIIVAHTLEVNSGKRILANGLDATDVNHNDGGGGGGAGGSVLIDVEEWENPENLVIDVSGGDGASVNTNDQHGPGGGGGGGYVNTTRVLPDGVTVELSGGLAGIFSTSNTNNPHRNTTHGATDGAPGAIVSNLTLQECSDPPVIDLNGANPGYDEQGEYTTGAAPVELMAVENCLISDADDTHMAFLEIEISNAEDGSYEKLGIQTDPSILEAMGITVWFSPDSQSVRFSGNAPIAAYRQAAAAVTYRNMAPHSALTPRILRYVVDDGGATSNIASYQIDLAAGVFPVEFLGFDASWKGADGLLTWTTAWEMNSDRFDVERSMDARLFETIGTVKSVGNSQQPVSYQFTDRSAGLSTGVVYYRLRQVDHDGGFMYSNRVELRPNGEQTPVAGTFILWPNPAREEVRLRLDGIADAEVIEVFDLKGRPVIRKRWVAGDTEQTIDINLLLPGYYVVKIQQAGGQSVSQKLKVQ